MGIGVSHNAQRSHGHRAKRGRHFGRVTSSFPLVGRLRWKGQLEMATNSWDRGALLFGVTGAKSVGDAAPAGAASRRH